MVTTFLAVLALILASAANSVAMFWFVFGVWPQAWWPIPVFSVTSALIASALSYVMKEAQE